VAGCHGEFTMRQILNPLETEENQQIRFYYNTRDYVSHNYRKPVKNNQIGQFTKYTITTSLTQVVLLLCAVAASVITARILGPEGKGLMSLSLLIPSLAITFGRMGIGHAVNYYSCKTGKTHLIINSIILGSIISAVLLMATLPVVFTYKKYFFVGLSNNLLIVVILFIPMCLLNTLANSLIQGMYKIVIYNLVNIFQAVVNLSLVVIFIYIMRKGVLAAVLSYTVSVTLSVFVSLFYLSTQVDFKRYFFDRSLIKKLLRFGSNSHVGNILKDLSYRGDILIISYFLPPTNVGYYIIAVAVAEIMWKFPEAIGTVLLPKVANMTSGNARLFTPKICRIIIVPLLLICGAVFFLSKYIIIVFFGNQYKESISALVLLLPGIFFMSIWKILANDLIAQGYPRHYSITSGVALIVMVFLDILLIPVLGINGASISSSISYIVATILIIIFYINITGNSLKDIIVPRKEDIYIYYDIMINIFSNAFNKYLITWKSNA